MAFDDLLGYAIGAIGAGWGLIKVMLAREVKRIDELHTKVDKIEKEYMTREECEKRVETIHSHIRSDFNAISDLIKGLNDRIDRLFEKAGK